jgi:hypothetical protein
VILTVRLKQAPLTANESASVHKNTAFDAGLRAQVIITQAPPHLWQRLAALKAVRSCGYRLNSPSPAALIRVQDVNRLSFLRKTLCLKIEQMLLPGEERVQDDDPAGGILGGLGRGDGADEEVARRQPGVGVVVETPKELFAREAGGDFKSRL